MARSKPKDSAEVAAAEATTSARGMWEQRVDDAVKRLSPFWEEGKQTVDRYRMQRSSDSKRFTKDKYNILYSSTETTKPSLYSVTPKVQATKRHRDRENMNITLATQLIEIATQFSMEELSFDAVLENCVKDYLLPGIGVAWVRYDPKLSKRKSADSDEEYEVLENEGLALDYVHYSDMIWGVCRTWEELPWGGRRVYLSKAKAKRRFGEEKANKLVYSYKPKGDVPKASNTGDNGDQAVIWELWDKDERKVVWYSPDYPLELLDERDDPLRLRDFFPFPKPIRAVWCTDTFTPSSFFSQYRPQQDALDDITARIRVLTGALRVVGIYDGSQANLASILAGTENKMVPVENWAAFASSGGLNGALQFVPIKDIAAVLTELYRQREIAKAEIYEITGFSDIQRGVSKASETLGAQKIKSEWAGGRLKEMQKEVQRFCRDIIRIMSEIICEHFGDDSLALYAGFEAPPVTPEEQQAAAQYAAAAASGMPVGAPPATMQQQAIDQFKQVTEVLRKERSRAALIGIETDSTIQPDESQERADRMEFLGQIGAFLQQAGPMALQYPDMRGLLGAIMMFVVRTFRSSRPVEKEFEDFQKKLAQAPAQDPNAKPGEGGDDGSAKAATDTAQIKAQSDMQLAQSDAEIKKYEIDQRTAIERERIQSEERMSANTLAIKQAELELKRMEAEADARLAERKQSEDMALKSQQADHQRSMDITGVVQTESAAQSENENREADRAIAAQKAAQKPASGPTGA